MEGTLAGGQIDSEHHRTKAVALPLLLVTQRAQTASMTFAVSLFSTICKAECLSFSYSSKLKDSICTNHSVSNGQDLFGRISV